MSTNNYCFIQTIDLQAESGDDYDIPLSFTTGSFPSTVPQPITGWTLNFVIKDLQSDPPSKWLLNLSVTNHVDPVNGLSLISVPAATTATLGGTNYYYLSWVDNFGGIQTFMKGKIQFLS